MGMSIAQTPILLFGESYHHPNIFYRTGFLAPDPVVVVDRGGDDTVLWTSRLEEGRARKEARVGRVRCTEELDWAEKMSRAGAECVRSPTLIRSMLIQSRLRSSPSQSSAAVEPAYAVP